MSRNGSGTFLVNSAGQPVVAGTTITATAFNAFTADVATGLTQSICVDGQTPTTASIPFAAGLKTDILAPFTANGPISVLAGQLAFPAVQNPSSNANTLDDYEEGTWVPADVSGAGLTITVSRASYVKVGSGIWCDMTVSYPATADTSQARLSLPVTMPNISGIGGAFAVYASNITTSVIGELAPAGNYMSFVAVVSGGIFQNNQLLSSQLRAQFFIPTV